MTIGLIINWLLTGALLTLVAIGFTLIFGVGGVINLAHGVAIVLGAFSAYVVTTAGFSIWLGLLAAVLVPAVINAALYLTMVRKIYEDPITTMIVTFVVFLIVEESLLLVFSDRARTVPALIPGSVDILGYGVQSNRALMFLLSWIAIGLLFWFVNYTRTGKAILAMSMSEKGAKLVGVDYDRINLYIWIIAAMFAGLAGLFIGAYQTVTWDMGITPLLMSFVIVILGGIGSIRGSVIGAYVIALVDVATVTYLDPTLRVFTPLVVLLVVMLVKPQGLYGREFVE